MTGPGPCSPAAGERPQLQLQAHGPRPRPTSQQGRGWTHTHTRRGTHVCTLAYTHAPHLLGANFREKIPRNSVIKICIKLMQKLP